MKIKWGIIGCGDVADHKIGPAFNRVKDSELVAVMRRNAGKAKDFARRHKVPKYYSDVDALLRDDEINAVYIATPHYLHAEHTVKAAEYGKHVLCEKPMAITIQECQKMINACETNKVKLMIAYYQRLQPAHQKIRELISQGAIGKIIMCKAQTGIWRYPADWFGKKELSGGGVLMEVGTHIIDLLRFLLGEIVEVSAYTDVLLFGCSVEDTSSLIVRFEDGVHGSMSFSYAVPDLGSNIEICGTQGKISWSTFVWKGDLIVKAYMHDELPKSEILTNLETVDNESREYRYETDKVSQRVPMIKHFVECVNMSKEPLLPGIEGLKDQQVILAAYESSKTKRAMRVNDVLGL